MAREIERKFLVVESALPQSLPPGEDLEQGYLSVEPVVRVRLVSSGGEARAKLTVKGPGLLERAEFEYAIPVADAKELLGLCVRSLRKVRRRLDRFELDFFPSRGLWLAEIELKYADEPFVRPDWLGAEVTGDPAYSNTRLASPRAAP